VPLTGVSPDELLEEELAFTDELDEELLDEELLDEELDEELELEDELDEKLLDEELELLNELDEELLDEELVNNETVMEHDERVIDNNNDSKPINFFICFPPYVFYYDYSTAPNESQINIPHKRGG
jgi:hypothetical protein